MFVTGGDRIHRATDEVFEADMDDIETLQR